MVIIFIIIIIQIRKYNDKDDDKKHPTHFLIKIKKQKFDTKIINVHSGDYIKFHNKDILRHSFYCVKPQLQNIPLLVPNEKFLMHIDVKPDEYHLHSSLYPKMKSLTIKVVK